MRRGDEHPAASIGLAWLPPEVARHRRSLIEASMVHGLDPRLVAIIVIVESRGDPAARSPAGARGLMQVMPATARYIARSRGLSLRSMDALFEPELNLDYGAWFLARLLEQFHHDDPDLCIERAAGAYNGGPGRMRRHLDRGRRLPPETRRYMATVRALWEERDLETSPALARLWPGRGGDRVT